MKERFLVLDGLRGLAILLVMICHTCGALNWPGPYPMQITEELTNSGVDLFFVLSGFLLFYGYAESILIGAPWPSWRNFYMRRARRILPLYYATTLIYIMLLILGAGLPLGVVLKQLPWVATLLYDMRQDTWLFIGGNSGVLWTLCIEWQFYLILPWIAILLRKWARGQPQRLFIGLVGIAAWGISVRGLAVLGHYYWGWAFPILPLIYGENGKRLELFALGMSLAGLYVAGQLLSRRAAWTVMALCCLGLGACVIWAHGLVGTDWSTNWSWGVFGSFVASTCYAGVVWVCLSGFGSVFSTGILRWLGKISYSIYLIHGSIIFAVGRYGPWAVAFSWGIILLLSMASYHYIELPFLKTRPKYRLPATQIIRQHAAP